MSKHIPGGLLVVVEGIDGAGKTTLAHALARELRALDVPVSISKEPTAQKWGAKLRASAAEGRLTAEQELEYLVLDRRQHVEEVISPALARGEVVILDRYFPSTVAYQGAAGLDVQVLLDANDFAPEPDLLLLLDVDPSVGLERIYARGDAPNLFETIDNLTRCRAIFLELSMPSRRVVDASKTEADVLAISQKELLLAIAGKLWSAGGGTPDDAVAAAERLMEYLPALH